jgi:RNA polymerase sigma factor (sigma-70 family)
MKPWRGLFGVLLVLGLAHGNVLSQSNEIADCPYGELSGSLDRTPRVGESHDIELVRRLSFQVLRSLKVERNDIEDLVNDICLYLLQSKAGFDGRSSYGFWIRRVARNKAVRYFQSQNRKRASHVSIHNSDSDDFEIADRALPAEEEAAENDEARAIFGNVLSVVKALRLEDREVFLLQAEGLTLREIASRLSVSESTVGTRSGIARDKMQRELNHAKLLRESTRRGSQSVARVPGKPVSVVNPHEVNDALALLPDSYRQFMSFHWVYAVPFGRAAQMANLSTEDAANAYLKSRKFFRKLHSEGRFSDGAWLEKQREDVLFALGKEEQRVLNRHLLEKLPPEAAAKKLEMELAEYQARLSRAKAVLIQVLAENQVQRGDWVLEKMGGD